MNSDILEPADTSELPPGPALATEVGRDLTQSSDRQTIKDWLNQHLQSHAVHIIELNLQRDDLQIALEANDIPDQGKVVPLVHQCLSQLDLPRVATVTLFGQKTGSELPHWKEQINLATPMRGELELASAALRPSVAPELNHGSDPFSMAALEDKQPQPSNHQSVSEHWVNRQLQRLQGHRTKPDRQDIQDNSASARSRMLQEQYQQGIRDFSNQDLSDVDLSGVTLSLGNFQAAKLTWANLRGASFWQANLRGANLRNANLQGANLQGANLQGADLQEADLTAAQLNWAVLSGANLTDANLTDANLAEAQLERVIMPDGTMLD